MHARLETMAEETGTMRNMLIIMVLIFISVIAGAADALTGAPRIVDGDTIWIGESKIRLHGIDALRLVRGVFGATAPHTAAEKLPQTPCGLS